MFGRKSRHDLTPPHIHQWGEWSGVYSVVYTKTVREFEDFTGEYEDCDPIYVTRLLPEPYVEKYQKNFQSRTCSTCGWKEAKETFAHTDEQKLEIDPD